MKKNIILFITLFFLIFVVAPVYLYSNNKQYNTIKDTSNIENTYLAFYSLEENTPFSTMPGPNDGYTLDKENSYCEINGVKSNDMSIDLIADWKIQIHGLTNSKTRCNLYFKKMPNPLPDEVLANVDKPDEAGNGIFSITPDLEGWEKPELRYAGVNYNSNSPETPYVHNYVTFNNEKSGWRIIGLVNVKTTSGNIEQRLKLIKDKSIGEKLWDSDNKNDWTQASLMKDLNEGEYYQTLTPEAIEMIDSNIIWNIGGIDDEYSSFTIDYFYQKERGTKGGETAPKTTEWPNGKVGLMYPSDYGYAVGGTNRNTCITSTTLINFDLGCYKDDWLFLTDEQNVSKTQWSLSPRSTNSETVYIIYMGSAVSFFSNSNGNMYSQDYGSQNLKDTIVARPVVYLSTSVKISNGTGEFGNPYQLSIQ